MNEQVNKQAGMTEHERIRIMFVKRFIDATKAFDFLVKRSIEAGCLEPHKSSIVMNMLDQEAEDAGEIKFSIINFYKGAVDAKAFADTVQASMDRIESDISANEIKTATKRAFNSKHEVVLKDAVCEVCFTLTLNQVK